ncbi:MULTISPECIES: 3'-5' exonuclease [Virgibacillus]|uniref:3'-5' exonuclease n=1 Tax=Virgibacillus salarius TaxID=447199 RepID=A0A941I8N3_9BACI|nr:MULTISPECIES: 3'-5' exonuclease [Virgibacillus]MBR7794628.1 3'-5' exonuclease [Virgibacillus salarius]MDY7044764.1 3'-5' exonuclease [Virgibacillus sp. M23]NAZ07350.1 hypothetical protein [Agaribacter marinus]
MDFVSIDFETANEKRSSPCAVGIVVSDGENITDEYYSLINPMMNFRSMNIQVHGIREDDVIDAPTFPEIWSTIHQYLSKSVVIAHNASFDMSVIRHTLDHFQLTYPEINYLCTVAISKSMWPGLYNYKLNTLAEYHKIMFNHHNALEDARVAARVFLEAIKVSKTNSMEQFLERCHLQTGKIYERGYHAPKMKRSRQRKQIFIK